MPQASGRRNTFDATSSRDSQLRLRNDRNHESQPATRDQRSPNEHYSLIPVDSAPLPPHERTWRHPSELAASTHEVDPGRQQRGFALAGGALALVMVATMVVALTPRESTTTATAITATTVPVSSLQEASNTAVVAAKSIRSSSLAGFTAIPNAIANIPAAVSRSLTSDDSTQAVLPDLDDRVTVLTEQYVYAVAWRDVTRIDATTDAVVIDKDGYVVARIEGGRLIVSHDLLVGASLSLD